MKKSNVDGLSLTEKIAWFTLIALLVLLFWSHNYNDLLVTTRHGINFWNILFDGRIYNFFHENITESGNVAYPAIQVCSYNILVYIVFAIWNIPLAVLWKITSIDIMNNVLCLAWAKLLPVTAVIMCAWIIHLILRDFHISQLRSRFAVYLFFSSVIIIGGLFINCQYDSIGMVFQLLGLRYYLKNERKKYILFWGIASCFKLFAFLLIVPLILLREKKLWKICENMLLLLVPVIVTTFPFRIVDMIRGIEAKTSLAGKLFPMLFSNLQERDSFCWFIVLYGALMIWCYIQRDKEDISFQRKALWSAQCAMSLFFVFLETYPYWTVLMVPYVVMNLVLVPNDLLTVSILLETIGSCGMIMTKMITYYWCYFGETLQPMIWARITSKVYSVGRSFPLFLDINGFKFVLLKSCVVLAFSALMVLSYPDRKRRIEDTVVLEKGTLLLRFVAVSVLSLLPIINMILFG